MNERRPISIVRQVLQRIRARMLPLRAKREGASDAMPFPDDRFDVISSFNSLDHVDDLERTTVELARVLRPGGILLLLAEVNQPATIVEPITLTWDTPALFPTLEVVRIRRYEMTDAGLFDSIHADAPFDDTDPARRTGVLSVMFRKP